MNRKMSHRQRIDASHEARLWIKDVIIPAITAVVIIDRVNPMIKYNIRDGAKKAGENIKKKIDNFKKGNES